MVTASASCLDGRANDEGVARDVRSFSDEAPT
jgi:hypothetical protein